MEISLKLLPVSPVSRRVPVDARYAFRGTAPAELRLTLAGREVMRQKPGEPNAAGWSSGVRKLDLNRLSGRAEVKFELLDERGGVIADAVQVLEIVDAESRSTGRIDGAWCGLYHWSEEEGRLWNAELKRFTAADWRELVRSMHGIGMDVIVLQELFRNQEYYGRHRIPETGYRGRAFYPSELFPGRMEIGCGDPVEAVLSAADELGMSVFPGIGMYAWFDFTPESLDWHCRTAREVWKRYGHHRSFYGWYISEEVFGDLNRGTKTPEEIVAFFRGFGKLRDELDPTLPVMLAPNCFGVTSALGSWKLLARELDILCPFGFNRMPEEDLAPEQAIALMQSIADEGGAHLWLDMEIFLFKDDMALYPRPADEIFHELENCRSFEKVLCYQFPGLLNAPGSRLTPGGPETVKLYCDYRRRIHAD
ncbi:MAG: DUF4434 domain-containing protein [Lentisphaeria bacterium]|nr:DUF4434 domain-containing protein [Lentisphaeria bacterium]